MATKLDKIIWRESTDVIMDNRNILVALTPDQKIEMKPKGMKTTGVVSIGIKELYDKLSGDIIEPEIVPEETPVVAKPIVIKHNKKKEDDNQPMINLHDLRSRFLIAAEKDIPLTAKVKLEQIVLNLINEWRNRHE